MSASFNGPGLSAGRSRTGIPGVGMAMVTVFGRKQLHFVANCGQRSFKFNTRRLGRAEALRRALKARVAYELKGAAS